MTRRPRRRTVLAVDAAEGGLPRPVPRGAPAGRAARDWPAAKTLALLVVALALGRWSIPHESPLMDMDVYIRGARAVLDGEPLYEVRAHDLPFTYSPFAAGVFGVLAVLPRPAAGALLTGASLAAYAAVVVVCARRLGVPRSVAAFVAVGGLALEPLFANFSLGQVNLLLVLLVVVDVLVLPPGRRGWLVGVAAGIKIVPALFALVFLLRRDWGALARSAGGFVATVALGAVWAPRDSLFFWGGGFASVGRFGDDVGPRVDNQSLLALWLRLGGDASPGVGMALTAAGVSVSLAAWAAWRRLRAGDDVGALLAVALGSLLASPISWTHHWVWLVLLLLLLAARRRWVVLWALSAALWGGPAIYQSAGGGLAELDYVWWEHMGAALYTVVGLATLVWLGCARPAGPRPSGLGGSADAVCDDAPVYSRDGRTAPREGSRAHRR